MCMSSDRICGARWGWEFGEVWRGGDQIVNCFLIRIRKTFRGLGFCLVDCSWSSLFPGRVESTVKQARLLGPAFKDALALRFSKWS